MIFVHCTPGGDNFLLRSFLTVDIPSTCQICRGDGLRGCREDRVRTAYRAGTEASDDQVRATFQENTTKVLGQLRLLRPSQRSEATRNTTASLIAASGGSSKYQYLSPAQAF